MYLGMIGHKQGSASSNCVNKYISRINYHKFKNIFHTNEPAPCLSVAECSRNPPGMRKGMGSNSIRKAYFLPLNHVHHMRIFIVDQGMTFLEELLFRVEKLI